MVRDFLVIKTELIWEFFGLQKARGTELFALLESDFNKTLRDNINSGSNQFDKNIFIANALKLADNEMEEAYCLYHVAQNLEVLQRKSELLDKLLG